MLCFVFAALIVLLDQFIKRWVVLTIPLYGSADLIPGVIGLTHINNTGAAFSMLSDHRWLLAGISFAATLGLIFILLRYNEGFWGTLGLASVLGGTVGNLIDRAFNGYVVDMFVPQFMDFAIFNVADIFITLGGITFCIFFIYTSFRPRTSLAEPLESDDATYYDEEDYEQDYSGWDAENEDDSLEDTKAIPIGRSPSDHISRGEAPTAEPGRDDNDYAIYELDDYGAAIDERGDYYTADQDYSIEAEQAEQDLSGLYGTYADRQGGYAPAYDESFEDAETFETLETLSSLESELNKLDDYDVDALLREYGFEEDI